MPPVGFLGELVFRFILGTREIRVLSRLTGVTFVKFLNFKVIFKYWKTMVANG